MQMRGGEPGCAGSGGRVHSLLLRSVIAARTKPCSSSEEKTGPQERVWWLCAAFWKPEWNKPFRGNNANRVISLAHESCWKESLLIPSIVSLFIPLGSTQTGQVQEQKLTRNISCDCCSHELLSPLLRIWLRATSVKDNVLQSNVIIMLI